MNFNKNRMGLTLGATFGIMHAIWVIAIALGWGQRLANLWHSEHFLQDMHMVSSGVNVGTAITGIIGALIGGYIVGYVFAALWNTFGK